MTHSRSHQRLHGSALQGIYKTLSLSDLCFRLVICFQLVGSCSVRLRFSLIFLRLVLKKLATTGPRSSQNTLF